MNQYKLLSKKDLQDRNLNIISNCNLCNTTVTECFDHLFFNCHFSSPHWQYASAFLKEQVALHNLRELILCLSKLKTESLSHSIIKSTTAFYLLWTICGRRNRSQSLLTGHIARTQVLRRFKSQSRRLLSAQLPSQRSGKITYRKRLLISVLEIYTFPSDEVCCAHRGNNQLRNPN